MNTLSALHQNVSAAAIVLVLQVKTMQSCHILTFWILTLTEEGNKGVSTSAYFFSGSPNEHFMVKCVFQHREGGKGCCLGIKVSCYLHTSIIHVQYHQYH